jgi:hypothetical protein
LEFPAKDFMTEETVKTCGETAISLWLEKGVNDAFIPLYEGALQLLNSKKNTEGWKSLAVIYGHLCAYLSAIATTGRPPESTLDPEIYTVPEPGLMNNYRPALHRFYRDSVDLFISLQLLLYGEAAGFDREATEIALRIYNTNKNSFNMVKAGNNLVAHLITAEKFEEAIRLSFSSNLYLYASSVIEKNGPTMTKPGSVADLKNILGQERETFQQEIDKSTFVFGLLPVLLKIGNNGIFDPELARQQAEKVAEACLDFAPETYLPGLWTGAADIIKGIFNGSYQFQELVSLSEKFAAENNYALKQVCLLGGTFQKDIIPENVIYTHIIVFQEIIRNFITFPFLYRQIAIPFFRNYWEKKFNNNRFRFKHPNYVQGQLETDFKSPPDKIVQKILYTIITSLNIQYDPAYVKNLV